MLSIKIKSTHGVEHLLVFSFALCAVFFSSLPYTIQITGALSILCAILMNFFYRRHTQLQSFHALFANNHYLLFDHTQQIYLGALQENYYLSNYVISLNWQLLCRKKKINALLYRWQYDAATWRQLHKQLRIHSH